ncbi:MAG: penicillin-binding protein 2 [bacterium]|nr:penicillin-binding protein 2 [bacterium]
MVRLRIDRGRDDQSKRRLRFIFFCFCLFGVAVIFRLFQLQIVNHAVWAARASAQQEREQSLFPARGNIFMQDSSSFDGVYPLAINRPQSFFYAIPKEVKDPARTARLIAPLLQLPEEQVLQKLAKSNDPWEPLQHHVEEETAKNVSALALAGIHDLPEPARYYPEKNIASHILGFVRFDGEKGVGQYGLEGYFDTLLAGKEGHMRSIRDARGEEVGTFGGAVDPAENGVDITLTIDRNVQFFACQALADAVKKNDASGGSVVILDPKTGRVIAMCSAPDFDPNAYGEIKDPFVFNNPAIFLDYEPGSILKPMTMAAGIETGSVTPEMTYNDKGYVRLGIHTIRNSDGKANGIQTMVQVLQKSLNTGAVFVARTMEKEVFRQFLENFGLGKSTGIELATEVSGDMRSLAKPGEIYTATASYGQGITATPLQMVSAYGVIANGGVLMKPSIIDALRYPDGRIEKRDPVMVRRVVSERTATLLSGMLVSVVREGHGKRADVPGYTVAGKTGTAQIARRDKAGYEQGSNIGSFVGYAPIENPKFVMLTKIDRPKNVAFAESSAAPLFGTIAKFLLEYYKVPPS